MAKFSKRPLCLLACLLGLASAISSPPTLQESTLLRNSSNDSLLNSTLAALIPSTFTIRPSPPLDEPVLNRRNALLLTINVLGRLALYDFDEEQRSQTWHAIPDISINVVGPMLIVDSPLAMRKYAVWGIYKAVHSMVASGDFRARNYELFSYGLLVGYMSYNNGARGALGVEGSVKNGTGRGIRVRSSSVSLSYLPNATITDLDNNRVSFGYELYGHRLGESNVFMTLFTSILKAAPYPKTDRVEDFLVNTRSFGSIMTFTEREYPGPDGPFFEYKWLIQMCVQLPSWVISHGGRWVEADMSLSIDNWLVGAGVMRHLPREGISSGDGNNVSTA